MLNEQEAKYSICSLYLCWCLTTGHMHLPVAAVLRSLYAAEYTKYFVQLHYYLLPVDSWKSDLSFHREVPIVSGIALSSVDVP
jgi:hypothetical protein